MRRSTIVKRTSNDLRIIFEEIKQSLNSFISRVLSAQT